MILHFVRKSCNIQLDNDVFGRIVLFGYVAMYGCVVITCPYNVLYNVHYA